VQERERAVESDLMVDYDMEMDFEAPSSSSGGGLGSQSQWNRQIGVG